MEWNQGYIADIPYVSGFYRETAPVHMALAALLGGVAAPDPGKPYRYLDLGCGSGLGLCLLAAANPFAQFVGLDLMTAHVAAARRLIAEAGLTNVTVLEASFAEAADGAAGELGQFEFVVAHGVYTWIPRPAQQDLVRVLRTRLAPGGMVYLGYNNMAAWWDTLPLQKLLLERARRTPGDSLVKIRAGLDSVLALHAAGAPRLVNHMLTHQLNGKLDDLDALPRAQLIYIAHEYLSEAWRPIFFDDLARDMAEAQATFAGRANLMEVIPELRLTRDQQDAVGDCLDPFEGELQTDVIAPIAFRRDVFTRGGLRLTPPRREAQLRRQVLALVIAPDDRPSVIPSRFGEVELDKGVYDPVFARLAEGPASLDELVRAAEANASAVSAVELAAVLVGSGAAAPLARLDGGAGVAGEPTAERFNVAMVEGLRDQPSLKFALASPLLGTGVETTLPVCLAILSEAGRRDSLAGFDIAGLEDIAAGHREAWRALRIL